MPKLRIEAKAQLDGVKSITFPDNYPWFCNILCSNCGGESEKPVVLLKSEEVEGVRGSAPVNLRRTCKFCGRVADFRIMKEGLTYGENESPNWGAILEVEARGGEISSILLADDTPLKVCGADGFEFEDVTLEDGEFYGYDEKAKGEASVTEFATRVIKV